MTIPARYATLRRPSLLQSRDDELGIRTDAAQERGVEAILISEAEKCESGSGRDEAVAMLRISIGAEDRHSNPTEVGPEAGAPDDRRDFRKHLPVFEEYTSIEFIDGALRTLQC